MTQRRRLADRRLAETFELEVGSLRYTATIGRYADGMVGEIFPAEPQTRLAERLQRV